MTTSHTLTGDLFTILGADPKYVTATIETNLPAGEALVDYDANRVMMRGPERIPLASDMTFSITLLATDSTGINVDDGTLRYTVRLRWTDATNREQNWSSGGFELTADGDLSDKAGSASALPTTPPPAPSLIDSATAANIEDPDSQTNAALLAAIGAGSSVLPNGIVEGRTLFTYGPSRGVFVTASKIHYDRLRNRMRSGFSYNGCTGGYFAADSCTVAYGSIAHVSQHGATDASTTSSAASTWLNRAMWGGVVYMWPFGADARDDGLATRNSTQAKARASAANALHAFIALVRAEVRIESSKVATYGLTNGSPTVTGLASPWYKGMLVQATGIPANTYIGDLINGGLGGFKLSSSRTTQVDVNATATNAAASVTITPVYTGTWTAVNANTAFSDNSMIKTNANSATSTYVLHLPTARRVHWVTTAVDDAEYAGTKGAPYGGTGGASYSIAVNGGTPITGTTSNEHRFGALNLCHGQKAVDLGTLAAGVHTIAISSTSTGLLVDECLLIDSLTPPTVVVMKEVELPAAYYVANAASGASLAKTQHYNTIIDAELATWPADESVIAHDITPDGYDPDEHISGADGAWAHLNDLGEDLAANSILTRLNQLDARPGLVWV